MTLKNIKELVTQSLLGNMVTKLMAMAIALALWGFAYTFSYVQPVSYSVPVRVAASEGWTVSVRDDKDNERQTVDVSIQYPRRFQPQVEQLFRSGGTVHVQVEPGEALVESGPDSQDIKVTLRDLDLIVNRSLGITNIVFHPHSVTLRYVREMSKSVVIAPQLSDPPRDYQVAAPYCTPRTVTVRGPKNIVANAAEVLTETIDISAPVPIANLPDWSVTTRASLVPYVTVEGQRYSVALSEDSVECRITLTRVPKERVFENVPILLLEPPHYPYVASLREGESTVSVRVSGPAGVVDSLEAKNITLFIDVSRLKPSEVPNTMHIEAHVVGVPNAGLLTVTPASPERPVTVAEPAPK